MVFTPTKVCKVDILSPPTQILNISLSFCFVYISMILLHIASGMWLAYVIFIRLFWNNRRWIYIQINLREFLLLKEMEAGFAKTHKLTHYTLFTPTLKKFIKIKLISMNYFSYKFISDIIVFYYKNYYLCILNKR